MMSVYVAMFVLQDRHKEANMQIFLDLTVHLFVTKTHCFAVKKNVTYRIYSFLLLLFCFFPQIYQIKRRPPNLLS